MMSLLRKMLGEVLRTSVKKQYQDLKEEITVNRLLIGKQLSKQIRNEGILEDIQKAEFKVFSQWGDDGIIQYLINNIDINNKIFVEFGVENYLESNTRFLLYNNNWSGLIIDGSEKNIRSIRNSTYYWKYEIAAIQKFVTAENINCILSKEGVTGNIGILHIDIDGNDYWVWRAIDCINPDIVIMEYNSIFGIERPLTVPYEPNFERRNAHFSNLYFGASLLALYDLAKSKGYRFLGSNSAGNNAYFVKKEKVGNLPVVTPKEGYINSKFRESRSKEGNLTYLSGEDRLKLIKGLPVYNTRKDHIEEL